MNHLERIKQNKYTIVQVWKENKRYWSAKVLLLFFPKIMSSLSFNNTKFACEQKMDMTPSLNKVNTVLA